MNTMDSILSFFFLIIFFFGLKKGLIKQISNLTNVFIGIVASIYFSAQFAIYLKDEFAVSPFLAKILAYAIIFIAIVLVIGLITRLLEKIIRFLHLSFLNNLLGGFFAFFKYSIYLLIPFIIFNLFNQKFNFHTKNQGIWYGFYINLSKIFLDYFR